MNGKYEAPSEGTNYKAFNYKDYLKTKYIYGSVTVDGKINISNKKYINPIFLFVYEIRDKAEDNLDKILGEDSEIVKRNIISEVQIGIKEETIENFRTSSIYHILAVSGTHVRNYSNGYRFVLK